MKYKHLFFDLDRTLWDFESNSKEAIREVYQKYGVAAYCPDFEHFFESYRAINEQYWKLYRDGNLSKAKLSVVRFTKTLEKFGMPARSIAPQMSVDYVSISPHKTKLFPGTLETLECLSAQYVMHIITNGFKEVQYIKLNESGLRPFFKHIFVSEEIGKPKPGREIFEFALKRTGVEAHQALMIGDDAETDIAGAANVGIDQVYFNPDNSKNGVKATYRIMMLKELCTILGGGQ